MPVVLTCYRVVNVLGALHLFCSVLFFFCYFQRISSCNAFYFKPISFFTSSFLQRSLLFPWFLMQLVFLLLGEKGEIDINIRKFVVYVYDKEVKVVVCHSWIFASDAKTNFVKYAIFFEDRIWKSLIWPYKLCDISSGFI